MARWVEAVVAATILAVLVTAVVGFGYVLYHVNVRW